LSPIEAVIKIAVSGGPTGTTTMTRLLLIGAVVGAAIAMATSAVEAANEKKMSAKPAGPGLCTAHMNSAHWGWMNYRTTSGAVLPTVMWCPEASCPGKC
jgi:hypothetical protein